MAHTAGRSLIVSKRTVDLERILGPVQGSDPEEMARAAGRILIGLKQTVDVCERILRPVQGLDPAEMAHAAGRSLIGLKRTVDVAMAQAEHRILGGMRRTVDAKTCTDQAARHRGSAHVRVTAHCPLATWNWRVDIDRVEGMEAPA